MCLCIPRVLCGNLDPREQATIRVEILEMERLRSMSSEPSSSQIIHMAFVILAFSSAGILTRDLNKHNWGIRRFSSDGVIQELVAIDGADWHQERRGDQPHFLPAAVWSHVEMDRRGGPSHGLLALQVERNHQDHAELATALLQRLQVSEAGQWVVASLHQQRVLVVSPDGDTCLCTSKASAFENRDWNLLHLGMPR